MKRINKLTPEQEARIPEWVDKWVKIGLKTGKTDWKTFEKYIPLAYKKAGLEFPNKPMIRVSSPLVGALASSVADGLINKDKKAVGSEVYSAVGSVVGSASLPWHYWFGGQFWVGGWDSSPSFVSFFTEVCGLELDEDIKERAEIYNKLVRSVNYFWLNEHFVMVCARPKRIARNESGQLHSDQVKAIEYPDGWGLYALDGVVLPEELWKKITSQTMTFKEIMAIEISDQRTVALKYNPEAIIKENAELVHKDNRNNELYKIENQQINIDLNFPKIWFLKMLCPTGRTFIEGVPPEEAEKNPDATAMQALLCGLSVSEYLDLKFES